jgi:hypothetical protein
VGSDIKIFYVTHTAFRQGPLELMIG